MSFRPAFEKHAIDTCEMSFAVLPAFDAARLDRMRKACVKWSEELPAYKVVGADTVRAEAIVPLVNGGHEQALQYFYMRPNGSPIWALTIGINEIRVVCTRYASWTAVWSFASDIFETLFEALAEFDTDNEPLTIAMAGLRYEDRFVSDTAPFSSETLFQGDTSYLPRIVRSGSHIWSTSSGWLESAGNTNHSNMLNIGSSEIDGENGARCEIVIDHIAQARFSGTETFGSFPDWASTGAEPIFKAMKSLHRANKDLMKGLLVPDMLEAIGME